MASDTVEAPETPVAPDRRGWPLTLGQRRIIRAAYSQTMTVAEARTNGVLSEEEYRIAVEAALAMAGKERMEVWAGNGSKLVVIVLDGALPADHCVWVTVGGKFPISDEAWPVMQELAHEIVMGQLTAQVNEAKAKIADFEARLPEFVENALRGDKYGTWGPFISIRVE